VLGVRERGKREAIVLLVSVSYKLYLALSGYAMLVVAAAGEGREFRRR